MRQTTGAKPRTPRTPRRTKPWVFASCNLSNSEEGTWNSNDGGEGDKGRECCDHYKKDCVGSNLPLLEFRTISINKVCEECFVEPRKRGIEENYEQIGKTDGEKILDTSSQSQFIWVCLDCNRCFCGGAANDSEPQSHVRQHAVLECHPCAVRADDPDFVWCFECNSLVRIQMPEGGTGEAESMTKVEVEGLIDGVESKKEMEDGSKNLIIGSGKSYAVRGLKNLGNTCFFNSVLQNLLAMDMFREYVMSLEWIVGPLATEMKKLLLEASAAEGSEVVRNPSSLFECICAKAPRFQGFQQQDSHELLRYLLDGLCTEEKTAASSFISSGRQHKMMANSGSTFVEVIFGGELSSTITCVECGHTSTVYEPFLDLSLPVPSKISPSKNVPLALSKRSVREGKGDQKAGGEDVAEGSPLIKRQKTENLSPASECNESCIPPVEQAFSLGLQGILMGLDYDVPIAVLDGADSTSQMCDVLVPQYFESGLVFQGENNSQCTTDSQTEICSKDVCGESSSRNENVSSCIQDSGVILLPYKNLDSTLDEINRVTQNQEHVAFMSSKVKADSEQSTYASSGQAEVNFGVLDDVLDEPEITSDCKTGTAAGEDIDITLWAGNNSESDDQKVDDTDGPVSVDSCLALFTKSELLSDEHAWLCEQCSGNSRLHDLGYRKSKSQAGASLDQSETLNSQVDGSEVRSKTASLSLEVDHGKMASTPENLVNVERLVYTHTTRVVSQNVLDFTGILDGTTCKYGQAGNEKISESLGPISIDQIQCPDVLQKDANFAESSRTSQYISCPAAQENSFLQESPGNLQSDSCSVNDQIYVECGRPAQPAASSSRDLLETFLQSSCDNDSFSEINQIGKGSQLFGKVNPTKDDRNHEMELKSRKVKRDATIRVLINKTPPILTIHLKRFNQDANGRLNKLRGHVSFQETLDIGLYMDLRHGEKRCRYQLIGMVEHLGTMTGGHYIAYVRGQRSQGKAKNNSSPAWFRASDAQVHEVSLSEVLQSEAYILFYERV